MLNTSIESNASEAWSTANVRVHLTGKSRVSDMYNVEGASSVATGNRTHDITLNIADYFSDIFTSSESYIIDDSSLNAVMFAGSFSNGGGWDYGSYKSASYNSAVLSCSQTEFVYDGTVEPFKLSLNYDWQANATIRTIGSNQIYCVQGYNAFDFYFDLSFRYQLVGGNSGGEDLPEENPDSTVKGWNDIVSYTVYSNGKDFDASGSAAEQNPNGNFYLLGSYSGLSNEQKTVSNDSEIINYITYGENAYRADIPIVFNFGIEESITLDGDLHYPIKFSLYGDDDFNGVSIDAMELELYDSMGNRINTDIEFVLDEANEAESYYDVLLKLRFDKRFIDKNIYGFIHVYASYGWDLNAPSNSGLTYLTYHDNTGVFSDYHTLKYYKGNISNKELVTYQQAGHFEVSEDGSLTWIEGDTVTEYVGQEEEAKQQTEELKEQTETQKGIFQKISEFFGSFFQNLIDSIIHIFVPTKEEMSDLFDRLNNFFAETFGFLYYPFDFIIDAFNIFLEADSETGLTLPGFSIMGHEVWGDQTYDIASEPIVGTIFGYVRMGTGAMLAMWFVNYLRNFFDKRFGGGGN